MQGGTYTVVVNSGGYPYSGAAVGIWIDYNHDGLFEGSEYSLVGIGSSGDQSASFTVPITALTGKTGLRVRNTNSYLDSSYACTYMGIGTTEDYVITIDTSDPCTGTPMAGTLSALHAVCPATAFMVSAAGYSVASGLAFQWLSRPAGAGAFTAVPGSTSASLAVSSQLAPTDYEFQVTCVSSGMSATSAAITINELPFYKCYCDSVAVSGSAYYTIIDSVAIGGTTLHNYTPSILSSYAAFPAADSTTATMKQGSAYHLYVNAQGGFYTGYPNYIGMWIDYDHSGTFDPGEYTTVGTNVSATATTFFTIPLSARTGPTAMRIRNISTEFSDTMGAADACTQYSSGNTEDYIITIDSSTLYVPQTINAEFMVKAFPNPVNNIVTIQTSGTPGTNCTISLTDITGRIIEKTNVTVIKTQLDMSGLAAGIYVIKYEDDEHSRVIKIIRQ